MSKDRKCNAEEIASKLEAKAKQLRESGLSREDLDMAVGGEGPCPCCGSSCTVMTFACCSIKMEDGTDSGHPEACANACIASSPD